MSEIGKPERKIDVDPLPQKEPTPVPSVPERQPEREPDKEPVPA